MIRRLTDRSVWRQRWQGLALSRTKGWWKRFHRRAVKYSNDWESCSRIDRIACYLFTDPASLSLHGRRPGDAHADIALADEVALAAVRRGVVMFVIGRGFMKLTPPLGIEPAAAVEAADVLRDFFE